MKHAAGPRRLPELLCTNVKIDTVRLQCRLHADKDPAGPCEGMRGSFTKHLHVPQQLVTSLLASHR
jgi:hypothetical protein